MPALGSAETPVSATVRLRGLHSGSRVMPWLVAFGCAGARLAVVFWPLRLDVSGRARVEADGSWVVGGAFRSSVSVAVVWARGVPPQLSFLLFGVS